MQAIVIKTGEVVEVEKTATYCATWSGGKRIYNESELLFEPSTKIDGWVARNATGKILFFKGKQAPSKPNYEKLPKQWHGSAPRIMAYPSFLNPLSLKSHGIQNPLK